MAGRPLDLAAIAARASEDAGGVSPAFLDGYLEMLVAASDSNRRLARPELDACRRLGREAAERGVALRALVDVYLSATWMLWRDLPAVTGAGRLAQLRTVGSTVLRAADNAIAALADGYERAQRLAIRQEEALRREFVDDLLHARGDLGLLAERAARFGLRLASAHRVAVAAAAEPFADADAGTRQVEAALLRRFGAREVLVATKEGLLVCVAPAPLRAVVDELARGVAAVAGAGDWRVGVGRPHGGPGGVLRSYEEAREALDLAARLGLAERVLDTADLLVFRVLLRDRGAIADLVRTVLGPLRRARGGATPLLATLAAYFAAGGVATVAARELHVGVRTVTYRLGRVRDLTGYGVANPAHRFTLEAAVLGARLLDWPDRPVDGE